MCSLFRMSSNCSVHHWKFFVCKDSKIQCAVCAWKCLQYVFYARYPPLFIKTTCVCATYLARISWGGVLVTQCWTESQPERFIFTSETVTTDYVYIYPHSYHCWTNMLFLFNVHCIPSPSLFSLSFSYPLFIFFCCLCRHRCTLPVSRVICRLSKCWWSMWACVHNTTNHNNCDNCGFTNPLVSVEED